MYVFGKILDGAKSCVTIWKKLHVGLFLFCSLIIIETGNIDGAYILPKGAVPHIVISLLILSLCACLIKETSHIDAWKAPWAVFVGWLIGSGIGSLIFIACFSTIQQFTFESLVFLPCFWAAEVCLPLLRSYLAPG